MTELLLKMEGKDAEIKEETKEEVKDTEMAPAEETKDAEMVVEETKKLPSMDTEEDEGEDNRPTIKEPVVLNEADATLGLYCTEDVCIVSGTEGMNHLWNGCRANHGIKGSGRYYWEVKLMDHPMRGIQTRLGVSTLSDGLLLDGGNSIAFESSGDVFIGGEESKRVRQHHKRFERYEVMGILVNLNKKYVALYMGGSQVGESIVIPDQLIDEKIALYPTFACKAASLRVNFGAPFYRAPSFKCKSLKELCVEESEKSFYTVPEKTQILMPIGFDTKEFCESLKEKEEYKDYYFLTSQDLQKWAEASGFGARNLKSVNGQQANGGVNSQSGTSTIGSLPRGMDGHAIAHMGKKKRYVFAITQNLFPEQRKSILANFPGAEAKAVVLGGADLEDLNKRYAGGSMLMRYNDVKLPNPDAEADDKENFSSVTYLDGAGFADSQGKVEKWQRLCKLKSKADDLKPGSFFKEQITEFNKMKKLKHTSTAEKAYKLLQKQAESELAVKKAAAEKKKQEREEGRKKKLEEEAEARKAAGVQDDEASLQAAKEELEKADAEKDKEEEVVEEALEVKKYQAMDEFVEEDWMLALLRVELHSLLHAFKEDAPDRLFFPTTLYATYLRQYYSESAGSNNNFDFTVFGCSSFEELLELVPEIAKVNEDGLVEPLLIRDMDIESLIDMTEEARTNRQDRYDAGDENSVLHFKAQPAYQNQNNVRHQANMNNQQQPNKGGAQQQHNKKRNFDSQYSSGQNFQNKRPYYGR